MSETVDLTNKIPIIGDFYAEVDAYQWILVRRMTRTKRGGDGAGETYEDFEQVSFHPSLSLLCKSALRILLLQGVSSGELKSLREVIKKSEEIERAILDAIGDKI